MYAQVKDKLQEKKILEKKYEGYDLEEDGLLTYKSRMYIPNVVDLRRFFIDEICKTPYSGHPGYQKMIVLWREIHMAWGTTIDILTP